MTDHRALLGMKPRGEPLPERPAGPTTTTATTIPDRPAWLDEPPTDDEIALDAAEAEAVRWERGLDSSTDSATGG